MFRRAVVASNERGPTGDHGQDGRQGVQGEQGATGKPGLNAMGSPGVEGPRGRTGRASLTKPQLLMYVLLTLGLLFSLATNESQDRRLDQVEQAR